MSRLSGILNLEEFEAAARRFLPRAIFGYVSSGSENEVTLQGNRRIFDAWQLLQSALVNVSQVSQSVELLGTTYQSPFGIAPVGMAALPAYRGDLVLAEAARDAQVPFVMSGSSFIQLETVAEAHPGMWFQAYLPGEEDKITALLARVAATPIQTLVVTVDTPVMANRENHVRSGFSSPLNPSLPLLLDGLLHPAWSCGTFLRTLLQHGMPHFENNYATRGRPIVSRNVMRGFADRAHLDWQHLALVRRLWKGRLVVKGLLNPADGQKAVEHGADAIVVSNHGGRQLDGVPSPLQVLPAFVELCPTVPVLIDSGFRRGTDVLKALALGAKMVFVGRPFVYAAAVGGRPGVDLAIELLRNEVQRDMGLLGITRLAELDAQAHLLATPPALLR